MTKKTSTPAKTKAKANMTKHKTTSAPTVTDGYGLIRLLSESWNALRFNLSTAAAIAALSFVAAAASMVLLTIAGALFFSTEITPEDLVSGDFDVSDIVGGLIIVGLFAAVLFSLISSFTNAAYAQIVREGSKGRKIDFSRTVEFARSRMKQVFVTSLYTLLVVVGPLAGALVLAGMSSGALSGLFGVAVLGASVWAVISMFRYALATNQVAVFEEDLSVDEALARSRELMNGTAKWFMLKMFGAMIGASIVIQTVGEVFGIGDALTNVFSLVAGVVASGAMTLLYMQRTQEVKKK